MVTQQLLDYIKNQQSLGKSKEEITQTLLAQGWQAADVEQAFASLSSGVPAPISITAMPSASKIFNDSWLLYKARFKTLIAINAIPLLATFLFGLLAGITGLTLNAGSPNIQHTNFQGPGLWMLILLGIIVVIGLIYISIWSSAAQMFAIKDQAEGIGWKEAFARSKNKIIPFFTTGLLVGLAVLGGMILLIIPGILFAFWFSQTPYIVVEENLKNSEALKRSKYYVSGRVWQVFCKGFYFLIITILVYIGFGFVITGITFLAGNHFSWLRSLVSLFWTPLATVYFYQVYKNLKTTRP